MPSSKGDEEGSESGRSNESGNDEGDDNLNNDEEGDETESASEHGEDESARENEKPDENAADLDWEDSAIHDEQESGGNKASRRKSSGPMDMSRNKTPPPGPQKSISREAGRSRPHSPEGYPERSAIPEYARTPSRERRMRSTWRVKTPVLQVVASDETPPVALFGPRTKKAPTSIAEMDSYWKQKKMLTVPMRAKKSHQPLMWTEEKDSPEHLQHWDDFAKREMREDFLTRYSDHYKKLHPEKWSTNDLFSFLADAFVREDQVDAAGIPLTPKFLKKMGQPRVEGRHDVMLLNAIKSLHLDGRKFSHASSISLSEMLPISDFDVEDLKTAMKQYAELNAKHKKSATAGEAMEAATGEAQEAAQVQELLLAEMRVRTGRAQLRELRRSMEPLQRKVEEEQEEYHLIKGHLSRARTPEQTTRSRPTSAALLQMQANLRSDMEQSVGRWEALKQQEHAMERSVRGLEIASLQVRESVNRSRQERRERKAALKEEQEARAKEERGKQLKAMAVGDEMLLAAESLVDRAAVEAEDRSRNLMLATAREKLRAARGVYEESLTMAERKRRLQAIEQLLALEEEKRAGCDMQLELSRRHIFNANGFASADAELARRSLKRARDALDGARRDVMRTGAVAATQSRVQEVEDRLLDAERRWGVGGEAAGFSRLPSSTLSAGHSLAASSHRASAAGSAAASAAANSRPMSRGSVGSKGGVELEEATGNPQFEEQLTKLIHEKQKEVVEQVSDSLCSMQAWLFDLKAKRKARQDALPVSPDRLLDSDSANSTRPTSPR